MCCCNRPRRANNCVIVPAIPVPVPVGIPTDGAVISNFIPSGGMPAGGGSPSNVMNNFIQETIMPGGAAPNLMNNFIQNATVPSGMMPAGNLSGFTCNANFATNQTVMEPPLQCPPSIINHHNRVQHMVPCIKTNIHHVHNHHEWLPFEQSEVNQVVNHSHGVRPSDLELCNSVR